MKSISINYIIHKITDKESIDKIVEGCKSKKYKVEINLYDFSLGNQLQNYSNENVSIVQENYEDFEKAQSIILSKMINYIDSSIMCIAKESVVLKNLDSIDFNVIESNELNGLIYTDYSIDGIRCFLRSHYPNSNIGVPLAFWNTEKIIKHIGQENILGLIFNTCIGIHIPEDLCDITTK